MWSRHSLVVVSGALVAGLVLPAGAAAQGNSRDKAQDKGQSSAQDKARGPVKAKGLDKSQGVPPGQLPPAGQCRVWVEGTAPGQQAAPTDCSTAMQAAANTPGARVLYSRAKGGRRGGAVTCENRRTSYPTTAPQVAWASQYETGTRSRALRQWGIPDGATVAINDFNNDGRAETAVWNHAGNVVAVWHNPDGDAYADIVEVYCNGTRVNTFNY